MDLIALDDRVFLVAFNNATDSRSYLTLAASCDGLSWRRLAVLGDDPQGSFSYPTLQNLPEQVICPCAGLVTLSTHMHVLATTTRVQSLSLVPSSPGIEFACGCINSQPALCQRARLQRQLLSHTCDCVQLQDAYSHGQSGGEAQPLTQCCACKDKILCIYSVDYPPRPPELALKQNIPWFRSLWHRTTSLMRAKLSLAASRDSCSATVGGQPAGSEPRAATLSGSPAIEAWGRVSLGMKLAQLSRSHLIAAAKCPQV